MWTRAAVFVVWALVALTATFWGLRIFASEPLPVPAQTAVSGMGSVPRGDLVRLLGPDPVAAAVASDPAEAEPMADDRFTLLGVLSPRGAAASGGVALIAVDGQPARAYHVGTAVLEDTVLQSVAHNRVTLGPRGGGATVALELAPPAPAATGSLPAARGMSMGFPGMPAPAAMPPGPGARPIAAGSPTPLPPPKFVSTPPVYTAPQVMPQGGYAAAEAAEPQDGEPVEPSTDPNPLR